MCNCRPIGALLPIDKLCFCRTATISGLATMNISGVSSYERTCGGAVDPFQNVLPFLTSVIRSRATTGTSGDLNRSAETLSTGSRALSATVGSVALSVPVDHAFAEIPLGASEGHQVMPSLVTCVDTSRTFS